MLGYPGSLTSDQFGTSAHAGYHLPPSFPTPTNTRTVFIPQGWYWDESRAVMGKREGKKIVATNCLRPMGKQWQQISDLLAYRRATHPSDQVCWLPSLLQWPLRKRGRAHSLCPKDQSDVPNWQKSHILWTFLITWASRLGEGSTSRMHSFTPDIDNYVCALHIELWTSRVKMFFLIFKLGDFRDPHLCPHEFTLAHRPPRQYTAVGKKSLQQYAQAHARKRRGGLHYEYIPDSNHYASSQAKGCEWTVFQTTKGWPNPQSKQFTFGFLDLLVFIQLLV